MHALRTHTHTSTRKERNGCDASGSDLYTSAIRYSAASRCGGFNSMRSCVLASRCNQHVTRELADPRGGRTCATESGRVGGDARTCSSTVRAQHARKCCVRGSALWKRTENCSNGGVSSASSCSSAAVFSRLRAPPLMPPVPVLVCPQIARLQWVSNPDERATSCFIQ
jgi:hypothetical protein